MVTNLRTAVSAGGELSDIGLLIPNLDSAVTMLAVLYKTIFALYFLDMLAVTCSVCFTLTPVHEYGLMKLVLDVVGHSLGDPASCAGLMFAGRVCYSVHGGDDRDRVRVETTATHHGDAQMAQNHGVVLFIVCSHHVDSGCGHARCYAA